MSSPTPPPAGPPDPRHDSFADAGCRGRMVILQRALLSYAGLMGYLLMPTMEMRTRYVLAVARLPTFQEFHFFRSMFQLIDEAKKGGQR
jgi:hypothetical protein